MGAETRIAVAEDIVLDFAGLFSPIEGEKQAPESPTEPLLRAGEYKTITEPQKPAERLTEGLEGQQAKKLYLDTQREREDRQRSLEVYRTYQENIKTSSQLQTEILKGLKAGENTCYSPAPEVKRSYRTRGTLQLIRWGFLFIGNYEKI